MHASLEAEYIKQNRRNLELPMITCGSVQDYSRLQRDLYKNFHKVQDQIEITGEHEDNERRV